MAGKRVHFVMPDDLVSRIDAACPEGVSRGEFVRRAVEQALGESRVIPSPEDVGVSPAPAERPLHEQERWKAAERDVADRYGLHPPAPAEWPTISEVERKGFENLAGIVRSRPASSSQSKRDVRPIPKKGER